MNDDKLKVSKSIKDTVVNTYQKIENGVVGTYKAIENGVVNSSKKIENKFVDTFIEEVDNQNDGGNSNEKK